jgi:hypothetical protein
VPNRIWKQAGVAVLICDKAHFKSKLGRNNKGHYTLIKGTIHQGDWPIANIYTSNTSAPTFIKQALLDIKRHIDAYAMTVSDFNSKSTKKLELNYSISQMDLTDTYRTFHSTAADHTFFLAPPWNIFQNRSHLSHKSSLNK